MERDPYGVDPHMPGAKLDKGKPRVGLMVDGFSQALLEVARVTTYGAQKYTPDGWLFVPDAADRYKDALFRHLLAGDHRDPESDLHHYAHVAWNALALLELHLRGQTHA